MRVLVPPTPSRFLFVPVELVPIWCVKNGVSVFLIISETDHVLPRNKLFLFVWSFVASFRWSVE